MNFLIDTHALVWWLTDDPRVTSAVRTIVEATPDRVHVSAITAFEIATKVRLGKFDAAAEIEASFGETIDATGFRRLLLDERYALLAGRLSATHKDPFDRFLAAQAMAENLTLITRDPAFAEFGAPTLW